MSHEGPNKEENVESLEYKQERLEKAHTEILRQVMSILSNPKEGEEWLKANQKRFDQVFQDITSEHVDFLYLWQNAEEKVVEMFLEEMKGDSGKLRAA